MNRTHVLSRLVLAMAAVVSAWLFVGMNTSRSAETRFRPRCEARGPIVTLGDVADIFTDNANEAQALAAVELFPALTAARQPFLHARKIQDLLMARGIRLTDHRFSGANQIAVGSFAASQPKPLAISARNRSERLLKAALIKYLDYQTATETPWLLNLGLDDTRARELMRINGPIKVTGGQQPWSGRQRFQISGNGSDGPIRLLVDVEIALPPTVVVTVNAIRRGTVIGPSDVALHMMAPEIIGADKKRFHSLNEVLGKEAAQSIAKGKTISEDMIRSPLLVRRNDIVTVTVRTAGIRVERQDRATEDGSLGDVIAIEPFATRDRYSARVCGPGQVEVFPLATVTTPAQPTRFQEPTYSPRQTIQQPPRPTRLSPTYVQPVSSRSGRSFNAQPATGTPLDSRRQAVHYRPLQQPQQPSRSFYPAQRETVNPFLKGRTR